MKRIVVATLMSLALFTAGLGSAVAHASDGDGGLVPFAAVIAETVSAQAPGSCPVATSPGDVCGILTGAGQATHLGAVGDSGYAVLNFATVPTTGCAAIVASFITLTAANGDQVFLQTPGEGCFTSATGGILDFAYMVTGGTGRFAGAQGSGEAIGTFQVTSGGFNAQLSYVGTISSPGSLR